MLAVQFIARSELNDLVLTRTQLDGVPKHLAGKKLTGEPNLKLAIVIVCRTILRDMKNPFHINVIAFAHARSPDMIELS